MARVNSNEKGARFERRTCVALSLWVTGNRRDDLFWRSAMSGGRATLASRAGRRSRVAQCGDISAIDAWGEPFIRRFLVECKCLADLKWDAVIYGREGALPEVWDKPLREALEHDKTPFCVLKQMRKPEVILSTQETFDAFNASANGRLQLQATFWRDDQFVCVWHFRDLIARCDPSKLLGRRHHARGSI